MVAGGHPPRNPLFEEQSLRTTNRTDADYKAGCADGFKSIPGRLHTVNRGPS
jgi:hypothetical protein